MNTTENPDWLNQILDTLNLTEGIDTIDSKLTRPDSDTYDIIVDYGEERFEFQVETNGTEHGINDDGAIFDLTTPTDAHWYFASELYTRLQAAKQKLAELEANVEVSQSEPKPTTQEWGDGASGDAGAMLRRELRNVIRRYGRESDVTAYQAIGALRMVEHDIDKDVQPRERK